MEKRYHVYILANKPYGTLYIGITDNLLRRLENHRADVPGTFTEKYGIHLFMHYETYNDPCLAITREKRLKWWRREWKLQLIEENNPEWKD